MITSLPTMPADRLAHSPTSTLTTHPGNASNSRQYHSPDLSGQRYRYVQLPNTGPPRSEAAPTCYPIWSYYPDSSVPQAIYQISEYNGTSLEPDERPQSYPTDGIHEEIATAHNRHPSEGHHRHHPYRVYLDNYAENTSDAISREHTSTSHTANRRASTLTCGWNGCTYIRPFNRPADLLRHIKNIHVSPQSYPCWVPGCHRIFNRKDNLVEHLCRFHHLQREYPGRS
ncbi:uncharacterized protein BO80DRAFT_194329 [Aspergillus ibericus CBS 121593]|uniref:C2H2-type domain-containing protein n=1 Tax=Aspergillus ibericus CBS 121593 TaxID=1448316 RepID=A0A395GPC3_9EURO|nr:hypothetical protein BO80DRAFT_194329 [Aspergillus ibericus CBS 121593]RAK97360.1 hypothetical protein BO80DRAFT_194329 [Aspergillus ibericus CBS 121593]